MAASILGIEYFLPERVETLQDLKAEYPDWEMTSLASKTGIVSRHIAGRGQTASDLGYEAARRLLEKSPAAVEQVDFLLFCTQSPDHFLPTAACVLQDRLGLSKRTAALDFNLGCSGYVYGLCLAKSLVESGAARQVLLVTADTYTKFIHPADRTVRALFGDAAAATLIGAEPDGPGRIGEFVLGTDGKGAPSLIVPSGGMRLPRSAATAVETKDRGGCVRSKDNLYMDGPAIFTFAISVVPDVLAAVLQKSGWTSRQVDWFAYHQANKFMLESLAQESDLPVEKMVMAFEDIGNTVSASIPIAVKRHAQTGRLLPGQKVAMVGFGVGYSWGACTLTWGKGPWT